MFDGISKKKLIGCGGIPGKLKINPGITSFRAHERIFYRGCFIGMLLVTHRKSIIHQGIQFIFSDLFIANINSPIKPWYINIYPPWVFGFVFKKSTIPYNISIYRIFKSIWITWLVKYPIFPFGEFNFKITPFLV